MPGNRPDEQGRTARVDAGREGDSIEERLMDAGETSQRSIETAALEGFERDQESPDHPTRVKRSMQEEDDPSHSVGSPRHASGERGNA